MAHPVDALQQFGLKAMAFFLPFNMTFVYPFCILVIACQFIKKDFFFRFKVSLISPLVISFTLFFFIHIFGLGWTEDLNNGIETIGRVIPYLFFSFFWLAAKYENQDSYMFSFIAGTVFCSLLAHYNYFQIQYPHILFEGIISGKRDGLETSPFLSHIMYSPILALSIYLLLRSLIINKSSINIYFFKFFCLLLLFSNLSFSTGRSGFLLLIFLFACLLFETSRNYKLALLKIITLIPIVIFLAYQIPVIKNRVDAGINDINTFSVQPKSSLGLRYVFSSHAFEMFKENPLVGVGTGDFTKEYKNYVKEEYSDLPTTNNPHNQYLMILSTLGIVGFITMILMFGTSYKYGDKRAKSILIGYLAICFFESYLWRSNTTMAFLYFMAIFCQRQSFLFSSNK